ncbi:putative LysR family transcriptional regulator [Sulfitobacter noctilucicola]|uniref:DNA-binding transcriptional LysR family regulator n=2 Tax=Sulfitobacter noctilucicola TaxID=1342301 RepID=A0A7W6Q3Q5_9RHOB|nr:putative LysR family transcriptional regulator [Sulfitobacter noctilucicola]MBB4174455.1 DNA-binding transcriptional LysR family regulator [Sulfitobacter noctilucicola]
MSLAHIPAFYAVMNTGSLSGAARHLKLAHPTIRRQIEAMELELGTTLFTRAANGLTPTEKAHALMPYAATVMEEAAAMARAASAVEGRIEGTVRLTTSRIVATHIMPMVLTELYGTAPGLRFELAATDKAENLAHRAADIALRFTPPTQQALVAQRMPDAEVGFFASPDLALPKGMTSLKDVPFISDDREARLLPALAARGVALPERVVLRCDDPLAQLAHVKAGLGVGVAQIKLAAREGLVPVLPDLRIPMPCWLVVHEDQARTPHIRAAFDHLKRTLPKWM